jgi:hypothetical protein
MELVSGHPVATFLNATSSCGWRPSCWKSRTAPGTRTNYLDHLDIDFLTGWPWSATANRRKE